MTVISIQSQVVHGHVGNNAAVFPLQARGIEVAAVPTTLLSNHPHSRLSTNLPALQQGAVPVMFAPLDARSMTCG
jgi:pyridoxal/pyridoxine/pyridoxamine kinase